MGFGTTELIILLVIVALIFGTKKLRGIGGDLGGAVKGFKKAIKDESNEDETVNAAKEEVVETKDKADS